MKALLSEAEQVLFCSFLGVADRYLEFGTGGSTCLAAARVRQSLVSVDSSADWMRKVAETCAEQTQWLMPEMVLIDLGPIGQWGYPASAESRPRWPWYHQLVWDRPGIANTDVYFIDGRFRVACAMQVLLRCRPDAVLLMHDFGNRPQYHVVRDVAREIASVDTLSVFQRRPGQPDAALQQILQAHAFQPQ